MTETTNLETAALDEARDAYQASVAIADRCRSLHELLSNLHLEFSDVDPREMGAEAKVEQMAQFVDRQLLESMQTLIELTSVAERVPKPMLAQTKATVDELRQARDCLAPWRETVFH